jgi:predicted DNA-binding transcriptional regulator YafY
MNRVDRLVAIILFLQSRRVVRACDIADHFEISTRTVYRDVKALCEAGVPVAAEAGEGYSIVQGYHLPPVMFTREEASALFLGGKFVEKLTDASLIAHAKSGLLKIQSVLPEETQEYLERLQGATALFLGRQPEKNGFRDDALTTMQDAIVHRKILALEYYSNYRDSISKRDVEPLSLVYYGNHWHLIGYCRMRRDYRDFRTDRVKSIFMRAEHFRPREDFSLRKYLQDCSEMKNPTEIRVKFDQRIAASVRDKYYYGLVDETRVEDGVIMTFIVHNSNWIINWLLSYGTSVQVISPSSLRKDLLTELRKLVQHYGGDKGRNAARLSQALLEKL